MASPTHFDSNICRQNPAVECAKIDATGNDSEVVVCVVLLLVVEWSGRGVAWPGSGPGTSFKAGNNL